MNTPGNPHPVARHLIGTFLITAADAKLFFCAGIPFYIVHPVRNLPRICMDNLVPVNSQVHKAVEWSDKAPLYLIIFEGPVDVKALYNAVFQYNAGHFGFGNTFKESIRDANKLPVMSDPARTTPQSLKIHPCEPFFK